MMLFQKTRLPGLHLLLAVVFFLSIGMSFWAPSAAIAEESTPPVIPTPKHIEMRGGKMLLTPASSVIASNTELRSAANIVASELKQLTGIQLTVAERPAQRSDIVLELDPVLRNEAYVIDVDATAIIRAGSVSSMIQATVSLLQAVTKTEAGVSLPRMLVHDEPTVAYRGLMIDCARNRHSLKTLKQMVVLCRWYKIRYLHLHLTDDQSFTFPSTAMPELWKNSSHYSLEELRELEAFSRDHGVIIIPELDVPGHATSLVQSMPKLFGTNPPPGKNDPGQAICVAREETYRAIDTLVTEMCKVFQSTPYFHIGADEVDYRSWHKCIDTKKYMAVHKIDGMDELYRHFIVRMNEIVKKHGKTTLVWEGFAKQGAVEIPRDIIVMVFECKYNLPPNLLKDGYRVINAAWQPLYVTPGRRWSPEYIYGWNHYRWESCWDISKAYKSPIIVSPTDRVVGAQLCSWEQAEAQELASLRGRLAAMSERIWNPAIGQKFADFSRRFQIADAELEKLLNLK